MDFENKYRDYLTHKWFSERLWNKWIKMYAKYIKAEYKEQPKGGIRYAKIITDET